MHTGEAQDTAPRSPPLAPHVPSACHDEELRSEVLEDFPALLYYATSLLFVHTQLAEAEKCTLFDRLVRHLESNWRRYCALREDISSRTELFLNSIELGLNSNLESL